MAYINNRKTSVGKRRFYCETQALALENFIGAIYRRSHLKVPIFPIPILIRSNYLLPANRRCFAWYSPCGNNAWITLSTILVPKKENASASMKNLH